MVRLLVEGDERFDVSAVEIERGGLSYTVDTLADLAGRWPSAELFWLVGADAVRSFAKWREPGKIVELATVVVLQRAGDATDDRDDARYAAVAVHPARRHLVDRDSRAGAGGEVDSRIRS